MGRRGKRRNVGKRPCNNRMATPRERKQLDETPRHASTPDKPNTRAALSREGPPATMIFARSPGSRKLGDKRYQAVAASVRLVVTETLAAFGSRNIVSVSRVLLILDQEQPVARPKCDRASKPRAVVRLWVLLGRSAQSPKPAARRDLRKVERVRSRRRIGQDDSMLEPSINRIRMAACPNRRNHHRRGAFDRPMQVDRAAADVAKVEARLEIAVSHPRRITSTTR